MYSNPTRGINNSDAFYVCVRVILYRKKFGVPSVIEIPVLEKLEPLDYIGLSFRTRN